MRRSTELGALRGGDGVGDDLVGGLGGDAVVVADLDSPPQPAASIDRREQHGRAASLTGASSHVPPRSHAATPLASRPWPLSGIHHLGVAVADLDEAVDRYRRLFGAELEQRETFADQGVEAVSMRVGGGRVELLGSLGPDTPVGKFLAKRGPGMHHVAFEVDDVGDGARAARRRRRRADRRDGRAAAPSGSRSRSSTPTRRAACSRSWSSRG